MPVPQTLIDLLRVPTPELRKLAADLNVELERGADQWAMAQALASIPRSRLEEFAGNYLYAGTTSLSWVRLVPIDEDPSEDSSRFYPLYGSELEREEVMDALAEHSETNPFDESDRPANVTAKPTLVCARESEPGTFILTFAASKRVGYAIHNFEMTRVMQDDFFNLVLRLEHGTIEVRAGATRARSMRRTWIAQFAHSLGMEPLPVALSERDYERLHGDLNAALDDYKGKTADGTSVFDTAEYTKAEDVADLFSETEFLEATKGMEPITTHLLFDDPHAGQVRIYVSLLGGSIFVRTAAPEEVLQRLYEALERVKAGIRVG